MPRHNVVNLTEYKRKKDLTPKEIAQFIRLTRQQSEVFRVLMDVVKLMEMEVNHGR